MTFPLFPRDVFGPYMGLLIGTLVGIAFGFKASPVQARRKEKGSLVSGSIEAIRPQSQCRHGC